MRDQTLPDGKWQFDDAVTDAFEDMLRRSIPDYDNMRRLVFDLACRYVQPNTAIVDLGCSKGDALAPLVDRFGAQNHFIGVEVSEPMLKAAQRRFQGYIQCGVVDIRALDLRKSYPGLQASVTLAVLTIQFTPIEYRQRIIRNVFQHTISGGAFIMVEKLIGETAELDEQFVTLYHGQKAENGYSQEQIERKRMSLEGVLVPVTTHWNEDLLHRAGFSQVACFWRSLNFAAFIALK